MAGRYRLPALPQGDRPRARQAHGGPWPAADGDRRLERRARRDRQPGPRRERLARLLPLLHPGAHGPDRGAEGRSRPAGTLSRAAAGSQERPRADLAGRPVPARHPRRRQRDRREGERGLGDRRAQRGVGRHRRASTWCAARSCSRRPCASSRRRTRFSWDGPRSARIRSPILGGAVEYPEGVRENGMYCHGVQWLVGAARILAERSAREGRHEEARRLPRNGLSALGEDLALAARRRRGDRDLRRPAEPAGGRHGDDVRSGPNDLERLHRGGGLDVPSGPGGRARAAPSGRGDGPIDLPGAGGRAELGRRRSRSDRAAPCSARRNYAPPRSGSPANNPLIRLDIHGQHPREDEADGNHFEPCATSLETRAARRQRPGPRVRLFPRASRLDQSRRGG